MSRTLSQWVGYVSLLLPAVISSLAADSTRTILLLRNPSLANQILSLCGIRTERKSPLASNCNFKLKRDSRILFYTSRKRELSLQRSNSKCTESSRIELEWSALGVPLLDSSPCLRVGCIPTLESPEISQYPHYNSSFLM